MPEESSQQHEVSPTKRRTERHAPPSSNDLDQPLSPTNEPLYPTSLLTDPTLDSRGNEPVRVSLLRQAQQTYGNHALQRHLSGEDHVISQSFAERTIQRWEASRHERASIHEGLKPVVSHTPAVQRAIIADGLAGAGRMEEPERASFNGLLAHNNYDLLAFTEAGYNSLKTKYDRLAPLNDKVDKLTAGKKAQAKATLKAAYDQFLNDVKAEALGEGKPAWDAAVGLAIQQYNALPADEQTNTNAQYETVAKALWPTVRARGAMPASFWKSVKKNIKTGFGAAAGGAAAFSAECDAIYADMGAQFTAWDGTLTNRGAWWGSAAPGSTAGAKDVSSTVILELQGKIVGSAWRFSNSFTGGISFHKTRGAIDFIYHMQAP